MLKLGLIGDNIRASSSPRLHRLAGQLSGIDVEYDLLIPAAEGMDFDALFKRSAGTHRGLNITFPYKEKVVALVDVPDPAVHALGACNTVLFNGDRPMGYNTDYSGFRRAFANSFPGLTPGHVAMAGAGGVGKAIAFALADLGAKGISIYEPVAERAQTLMDALSHYAPRLELHHAETIADACAGATGLVNATPLGMVGIDGTAFTPDLVRDATWVFDAVYTPVNTTFLQDAAQANIAIMSGYELFFYQGFDAFSLLSGHNVDETALRAALAT